MALDPRNIKPGEQQAERYYCAIRRRDMWQYDYRDLDGELFSTIAKRLEDAIHLKNDWAERKKGRG